MIFIPVVKSETEMNTNNWFIINNSRPITMYDDIFGLSLVFELYFSMN